MKNIEKSMKINEKSMKTCDEWVAYGEWMTCDDWMTCDINMK